MKYFCPICNAELEEVHRIKYIDYNCNPVKSDHHFAQRIKPSDESLLKIKVRLTDPSDGTNFYLKVNYDEGFSQVWATKRHTEADPFKRIKFEHTFTPDYSDMKKLLEKIRTYLVFS